jgi:hypothetical protein
VRSRILWRDYLETRRISFFRARLDAASRTRRSSSPPRAARSGQTKCGSGLSAATAPAPSGRSFDTETCASPSPLFTRASSIALVIQRRNSSPIAATRRHSAVATAVAREIAHVVASSAFGGTGRDELCGGAGQTCAIKVSTTSGNNACGLEIQGLPKPRWQSGKTL